MIVGGSEMLGFCSPWWKSYPKLRSYYINSDFSCHSFLKQNYRFALCFFLIKCLEAPLPKTLTLTLPPQEQKVIKTIPNRPLVFHHQVPPRIFFSVHIFFDKSISHFTCVELYRRKFSPLTWLAFVLGACIMDCRWIQILASWQFCSHVARL